MENSYRIHTEITKDAVLNVNMKQDFDFLEVLSLKLRQADAYKLHSSNYGVIVGRVLANDAFGIPNAKVSVFIPNEGGETSEIEKLYPYSSIRSTDSDGRRYNLLPDYSNDDCYRVVGNMPNKRLVLDNDTILEVFDKYWKYSTVTNNSGDYMIFGVPSGNQELKIDLDLSDIGILSQKPTDFTYKGYNLSMFDSPTQFKESTNLESLPQIFSQNKSVFVYPFWGDVENGIAAITRSDVQIQYKFEPTCVFMGSIISDNDSNAINHKCAAHINNGMNDQLVTGEGNIEMIRKTPDGLIEEFQVQTGESLIDSDGVWCYQIPMNLDYVGMDEYGNIVPTDNPSKGVPTRTQVRFRISKNETGDEGFSRHTAKYLVPMNPVFDPTKRKPTISVPGKEIEKMYNFGSNTPQSCFRDLYWNNVYSVKNYIPKVQVAHRAVSKNYSALKGANLATDQNQIPFNKLRVDLPFVYMALCMLYTMIAVIVEAINAIKCVVYKIFDIINKILKVIRKITPPLLRWMIPKLDNLLEHLACIPLSAGLSDDNTAYYLGCWCKGYGKCPDDMEGDCVPSHSFQNLIDKVQQNLAEEFKIVKLDLYQDWVNGVLYMPLWYWRKRKKKTFLFGLIKRRAKNQFCSCDTVFDRLKTYVTCSIQYASESLGTDDNNTDESQNKWHKGKPNTSNNIGFKHGIIKQVENKDGLNVYYYSAIDATSDSKNPRQPMIDRESDFPAIRLYATDIILLGNLNEDNLYGIPQLFKALPSTTANVPPIATISEPTENVKDNEEDKSNSDASFSEDSGVTITTGMDWGEKDRAAKLSPRYNKGLFMDLACSFARTKAKSCINVERLSELGVNYDTNYYASFAKDSSVGVGIMPTDGFISKYELDDLENRAMFATMNYIGFAPQTYQESAGLYDTQVIDPMTGYLVPKFKFMYPVDFDGRLQPIMNRYKHGFKYSQTDIADEAYITFRLGAENRDNNDGKGLRHFYVDQYAMPLYDNSYYFYFGLIKGNSAIDKFNRKFFAECFKNTKDWFTMDVETQGESYCPELYKPDLAQKDDKDKAHGYIKVTSDDIQIPYSYTITNLDNGGSVTVDGYTDETFIAFVGSNGSYEIKVTDGNGKTIKRNVLLEKEKISIEYDVIELGTKFYNSSTSTRPYICGKSSQFYGTITFTGMTVDGYNVNDIKFTPPTLSGDSYVFNVTGKTDVHTSVEATVTMKAVQTFEEGKNTEDCCCKNDTNYDVVDFYTMLENGLQFNIYMPTMFLITVTQTCNEENSSSSIVNVENGKNFNTFLNDMPISFMLGTVQDRLNRDKTKLTVAETSNFYRSKAVTGVTNPGLNGWYGVHDESVYKFAPTSQENEEVWSDFVDYGSDFSTMYSKLNIVKFKFDSMFSVAATTYVTEESDSTYRYESEGGKNPILSRVVSPYYSDTNKLTLNKLYLYEDENRSVVDMNFPNIVGFNYSGTSENIEFNPLYRESAASKMGNYFAAFTNNGGYSSTTAIDSSKVVNAIPNFAAVNVYGDYIKPIGEEKEGTIGQFAKASDSTPTPTMPYFRAMYLDRRFDYNLLVFAPIVGYSIKIGSDNITWRSGRISGATYNGIEMAYDENYNIISATNEYDSENGELSKVDSNGNLEYSYSIPNANGEAKTIFNYNAKKKPYSASINGIDISDKFWSTNNTGFNTEWDNVVCFPAVPANGGYNDWFNINNYPTKRIVDVGNIPYLPTYNFNYVSCSYNGTVQTTEDKKIRFVIQPGEMTDINISFGDGIEFIPPSTENKLYSNVQYTYSGGRFIADSFNMRFKYKPFTGVDGNHDIYTSSPVIIGVKEMDGGNTITTIKRYSGLTRYDIEMKIKNSIHCITYEKKQIERPSGVEVEGSMPPIVRKLEGNEQSPIFKYFKSGNEFLTSDSPDFYNIVFDRKKEFKTSDINGSKVFTIMYKRSYVDATESHLNRYISTYEFGDMYDGRDIKIKPVDGSCTPDGCSGSYVIFTTSQIISSGTTTIPPQEEGGESSSANTDTSGDTSAYTQVLEFEIDTSDPNTCQIFNQADSMGYSMLVSPLPMSGIFGALGLNAARTVDNAEVSVTLKEGENTFGVDKVRIRFTWPQDMGHLSDSTWVGRAFCSIFAKASSGFTYRIGDFKLSGNTTISGEKSPTTGLKISNS